MADNFKLTAAAAGQRLTVDFTPDEVAYLQEWFKDTKQAGETVDQFVRRLTVSAALQHRGNKIITQIGAEEDASMDTVRTTTENTQKTLRRDYRAEQKRLLGS